MNIYIKAMIEDDDKEVVAQACTSIADIIRDYGGMEWQLSHLASSEQNPGHC